jgi:hypothetical protein
MTKTINYTIATAACFALSVTTSFAQSGRTQVKVPFEFVAGSSMLPAGDYNFQEEGAGIVYITSADAHKTVVVLTNAGTTNLSETSPKLKFDKVNGVYNLTEVGIAGEPSRLVIKGENAAERSASLASRTSVANTTSKSLKK